MIEKRHFYQLRNQVFSFFPDKLYLKLLFKHRMGYQLDLHHPHTFCEKLQWLKLYNRNPLYTVMVDKVKAKDYVSKKCNEDIIIPTLGVWKSADEVDFTKLPDRFVIKCNHNSGKGMYICRDKSRMDENNVREELRRGMNENYYKQCREWPYKHVTRRIIAEQYLENRDNGNVDEEKLTKVGNLRDYKFFCFNGEPKLCQVISDRATDEKIDFYDMNWNRLIGLVGLNVHTCNSNVDIACPTSFEDMKKYSKILSEGIPFVRIDFYDVNGHVYFGEITFFPAGGFGFFRPESWNTQIGEWLQLPLSSF